MIIPDYTFIDKPSQMAAFCQENASTAWLGFDTEFVGEKRYQTSLCLIQVATAQGYYLIDPLRVSDLSGLLALIEDPAILKITHAGENDYRLLYSLYKTVPQNVFDVQMAAAFCGYKYPVSFQKLVESELNVRLEKGYAATDWEKRPMDASQLKYALLDVVPLHEIWQRLTQKLTQEGRLHWAQEECARLCELDYYDKNPHHEALNNNLMRSLKTKERIFLIRLMAWRRKVAEDKNYSKEMILPAKYIGMIIRGLSSGKNGLANNRHLPAKIAEQHGRLFYEMMAREATPEERELLKLIPQDDSDDPGEDILIEMVYLLIKHQCLSHDISVSMVMPRNLLKRIKADPDALRELTDSRWKQEMLGDDLMRWIANIDRLSLKVNGGTIELTL